MRLWRTDDSSNVRAVGYADGRIQVEFASGALYEYSAMDGVPPLDEDDLVGILNADSVGRRVNEVLVSNKTLRCVKLRALIPGQRIDVVSGSTEQEAKAMAERLIEDVTQLTRAINEKHPLIMRAGDRSVDVAIRLIAECKCRG